MMIRQEKLTDQELRYLNGNYVTCIHEVASAPTAIPLAQFARLLEQAILRGGGEGEDARVRQVTLSAQNNAEALINKERILCNSRLLEQRRQLSSASS